MPGIIGIFSDEKDDASLFNSMVSSLLHQREYQSDRYSDSHLSCARVHLGVFNNNPQPVFNETRTLCCFFEGKIYGYDDKIPQLERQGHLFHNFDDAEFCVHSYEEYGTSFIHQLNGNFVFLIYNIPEKKITIANDRFGFRVHYYSNFEGKFFISPEIKTILKVPSFPKLINEEAIAEYFAFGECWGDKTLFQGIKILPPASILTFYQSNVVVEQYWHPIYRPDYKKSESEFIDELIQKLKHSVCIRMDEKHRYGVTLSGGLDSRTVIAAISPEKQKDLTACTFGSLICDEVIIAKKVSKIAGIREHLIFNTPPSTITENARGEIWRTEGRGYLGVSFGYPAMKIFSQKVDVIFDGSAMDLTLGGSYLTRQLVDCKGFKCAEKFLSKRRIFSDNELNYVFTDKFYEVVRNIPEISFKENIARIKSYKPADIADEFALITHVAAMHIGDIAVRSLVEVSHPTLDNDFIDLILTIPPELRLNHKIYRKFLKKLSPPLSGIPYQNTMVNADAPLFFWILGRHFQSLKTRVKRFLNERFPEKHVFHDTRSYVSFDEWFRTNQAWQKYFHDLLLSDDAFVKKYLNYGYVGTLYEDQIRGNADNSLKLLYISSFIIFISLFFNENNQENTKGLF